MGVRRMAPVRPACLSVAKATRVLAASRRREHRSEPALAGAVFGCPFLGSFFWARKRRDSHISAKPEINQPQYPNSAPKSSLTTANCQATTLAQTNASHIKLVGRIRRSHRNPTAEPQSSPIERRITRCALIRPTACPTGTQIQPGPAKPSGVACISSRYTATETRSGDGCRARARRLLAPRHLQMATKYPSPGHNARPLR